MLKYNEIIKQLSDGDKIRILCNIDSLSDKKYRVLGIPAITVASLDHACDAKYPSVAALANIWDDHLIGEAADCIFKEMMDQGADLVMIPGPKARINPYRSAVSEDPQLAEGFSAQLCKSASRFGLSVGIGDFAISADEIEWLDREQDERFLQEYLVKSYRNVCDADANISLMTSTDPEADGYRKVNSYLGEALNKQREKTIPLIYKKLSSDKTVRCIGRGGLCFEGSALALESALARYKQLKKAVEHGEATLEDLNAEISGGRAISPDMLDDAVDRLLDFAFAAKRKPAVTDFSVDETIALKACRAATVLLKNKDRILPLSNKVRVGILGDLDHKEDFLHDFSASLAEKGFSVVGSEKGYHLSEERSEADLPDALNLAKESDVVILFLGLGAEREKRTAKSGKISIPANQQALLHKLGGQGSKVIAVLPPECSPDVGMPEACNAILFSHIGGRASAIALAEILSGEVSPSGKLAATAYCHTEALYTRFKTYRVRDGLKTGPYIGYRYYDIAEDLPEFPFGHGLSYTKFAYSALSIENGKVQFTVTNTGKCAGGEIAQVYVGIEDSAVLRPKKELCGFIKIDLSAGEKKTVSVPLSIPEVYDVKTNTFVQEMGKYTVYVGASVTDIRLKKTILAGDSTVTRDEKVRSNYIQTESNIISDNFKLEAKTKPMKKSVFNYIVGALALVFAIVLKMYCAYANVGSLFFDGFAIALGIFGVVFFIVEAVRRNRLHSQEREAVEAESQEAFADAEKIDIYSANKIFVREFDTVSEEQTSVADDRVEGVEAEKLAYVDKDQNFESAARDFEIFASERGCKIDSETVKNIFASIASSRLIVLYGMKENAFQKLMLLLTGYFESAIHIDSVDSSYTGSGSVLFKNDAAAGRVKTNFLLAMESAGNIKHTIHFAGLDNVAPEALSAYFNPFVNYVKNPLGGNHVSVVNESGAELSYNVPCNLWLVLNLAKGATPDALPDYVAEVASVNRFEFTDCQENAQHTHVRKFSYYQLEHLVERAISKVSVPEELWKKIDRIEEYVRKRSPFVLGNKGWLCLEKYAYTYISCGGDTNDAVDRAAAAKLMAPAVALLRGKIAEEERGLGETVEMILGEERADACKRIVKDCEASGLQG